MKAHGSELLTDFGDARLVINPTPGKGQLLDLRTTMLVMGKDEDAVLAMIEDGDILYAFDLSSAPNERRLLRIWAGSVSAFLQSQYNEQPNHVDTVVRTILPQPQPVQGEPCLRTPELKTAWGVSNELICKLVRERHLTNHPHGAIIRRGRNGAPCVPYTSAFSFLRNRRVC